MCVRLLWMPFQCCLPYFHPKLWKAKRGHTHWPWTLLVFGSALSSALHTVIWPPSIPLPSINPSASHTITLSWKWLRPWLLCDHTCSLRMERAFCGRVWPFDLMPFQHVQGAQFQPGECHADAHKDLPQVLGEGGRQVHTEQRRTEGAATRGARHLFRGKACARDKYVVVH